MTISPIIVAREELATIALSYVGGDIHERVWLDVLRPPQANPVDAKNRPLSWCRGFVLHCLRERYRTVFGAEPPEDWIWLPGQGFEAPHDLRIVRLPWVGAEAYKTANQHGAIVTRLFGDGRIETVDGNSSNGNRSGVVAVHLSHIDDWIGFYDLDPLLPTDPVP